MNPLATRSYGYKLPKELIAQYPISPRDSAKLLVYDRKTDSIAHTIFREINHFLPADTALIFNDTKVIKARIFGKKESGGKVEVLINAPVNEKQINSFIRGKVHIGTKIIFKNDITATIKELLEDGTRDVEFFQNGEALNFYNLIPILDKIGHTPLPPYIDRADESDDAIEYQSVFAQNEGAVAAPTASLHFTDELFNRVTNSHNYGYITLHVGAGTFKPVASKIITDHAMHSERYKIPQKSLKILNGNQSITAVGTTVARTIEFYARTSLQEGEANLFLHPNNPPKRVNHIITNFHLPKSTLVMLVASFIGLKKSMELYNIAIERRYRFFSYGDAMLIL